MALRPDQTPPPQTPKSPRPTGSWVRLALLAGLGLYFVILLSPVLSRLGGPARVDLSYSQLITQIDGGNVADITIQGQGAQGDLKNAASNNGVSNTQFTLLAILLFGPQAVFEEVGYFRAKWRIWSGEKRLALESFAILA